MTVDLIRQASERWDRVPEAGGAIREPTPQLLGQSLGLGVSEVRLWRENWRNRIYHLSLSQGSTAVAKQMCVGDEAELVAEYESLQWLDQLGHRKLTIPKPLSICREQKIYCMEYVTGSPIDELVAKRRWQELSVACGLAGEALAAMHDQWTDRWGQFPVDEIVADIRTVSWGLASKSITQLYSLMTNLCGKQVAFGQAYMDYKPANILYDDERIALVDPPEQHCRHGILLWDLAVFQHGLESAFFKLQCRRPATTTRRIADECLDRFHHAYLNRVAKRTTTDLMHRRLTSVMELQRIGQLLALLAGRIRRCARQQTGIPKYWACGQHAIAISALQFQARRMARHLPEP